MSAIETVSLGIYTTLAANSNDLVRYLYGIVFIKMILILIYGILYKKLTISEKEKDIKGESKE